MNAPQEKRMMSNWPARVLAFAMLATATISAWADNAIQSITSTVQAGAEVVRVEFKEPLSAQPNGFAIQTPPRIALDFLDTTNGTV